MTLDHKLKILVDGKQVGKTLTFTCPNLPSGKSLASAMKSYRMCAAATEGPVGTKPPFIIPPVITPGGATVSPSLVLPPAINSVVPNKHNRIVSQAASNVTTANSVGPFTYTKTIRLAGSDATVSEYNVGRLSWEDSRSGVTLPNYKELIQSGKSATTDMTAIRTLVSATPGFLRVVSSRKPALTPLDVEEFCGFPTSPALSIERYESLVSGTRNKALAKIYDALGNIDRFADVGETLAEYKQALGLIGKPLAGLRDVQGRYVGGVKNILNSYRNTPSSAAVTSDILRRIGQLWLEFKFGWYPTSLDLIAAIKAAQGYRNKVGVRQVRASYRDSTQKSFLTTTNIFSGRKWSVNSVVKGEATARYIVGIAPEKVSVDTYLESIGVSPDRFIPTLYAILPYSWLADYFTGINESINALCQDISFTTWVNETTRESAIVEKTYTPFTGALSFSYWVSSYGVPSTSRTEVKRVKRTSPRLGIPSPVLQVPSSWKPYANIIALAFTKQRVGKLRHP